MGHILHNEDGICRDIARQNNFSLFRIDRTIRSLPIECAKDSTHIRHLISDLPGDFASTIINNAQYKASSIYR